MVAARPDVSDKTKKYSLRQLSSQLARRRYSLAKTFPYHCPIILELTGNCPVTSVISRREGRKPEARVESLVAYMFQKPKQGDVSRESEDVPRKRDTKANSARSRAKPWQEVISKAEPTGEDRIASAASKLGCNGLELR